MSHKPIPGRPMVYGDLDQAERCARLASAYSPETDPLAPFDDRQAWVYEAEPDAFSHDRMERRLAVTFAMLAGFALGLGIAWALP